MFTASPMYIHNIHHHNDIFNINNTHLNVTININIISSQCYSQHQHHVISMTLSTTTTSSHINIIINNNITSYQYYHKHQHSLVSIIIIIIFNNNIILFQHYHKHQCHLISINIINNNIINKSHSTHTYIYSSCLRFTFPRSLDNISLMKIIMSFINKKRIASHLSKTLFFLKTSIHRDKHTFP